MTERSKRNLAGFGYSVLGGLIVAITMFLMSAFSSDRTEFKKELIRLDKNKADTEYVDIKIKEVDNRQREDNKEVNQKLDRILELMIKNR